MIKKYKGGDLRQKAQGDMYVVQIDKVDVEVKFRPLKDNLIVGHSESGHHHVIVKDREKTADVEVVQDANGWFIRVNKGEVKMVHEKSGGHDTLTIPQGVWFIGVQEEYNEISDKRVQD